MGITYIEARIWICNNIYNRTEIEKDACLYVANFFGYCGYDFKITDTRRIESVEIGEENTK